MTYIDPWWRLVFQLAGINAPTQPTPAERTLVGNTMTVPTAFKGVFSPTGAQSGGAPGAERRCQTAGRTRRESRRPTDQLGSLSAASFLLLAAARFEVIDGRDRVSA